MQASSTLDLHTISASHQHQHTNLFRPHQVYHNSFISNSAMATQVATVTILSMDEEQRTASAQEVEAPTANGMDTEKGPIESMSSTVKRSKLEELLKRSHLILRAFAFLFSFLSFLIMASNRHGGWMDFNNYEEYRYLLIVSILTCVYTIFQILCQIPQIVTGKEIVPPFAIFYVDFAGDQLMAYLLLSSSSAALPATDVMRLSNDNTFTDNALASISMSLVAFFSLATSSIVSGFNLATHTHL